MSLPVVFRPAARAEYDDAADWYEARRPGLGADFSAEVQEVLDRIAAHPDFYPQVLREARQAIVARFPYCVYYLAEPTRIVVLSVFHTSRDPAVWQGRVP
jgi:plasmid stabilization system protein ParE